MVSMIHGSKGLSGTRCNFQRCSSLFLFLAFSLFHVGRLNRGCYLHINSVTELPPGRLSVAAACIAYGGAEADSPPQLYPVHQSYPHQISKISFYESLFSRGDGMGELCIVHAETQRRTAETANTRRERNIAYFTSAVTRDFFRQAAVLQPRALTPTHMTRKSTQAIPAR